MYHEGGSTCCCSAIPSVLTAKRKCPYYRECDIDAARAGKTSGTEPLTGGTYDDRAGSDIDGSEHTSDFPAGVSLNLASSLS